MDQKLGLNRQTFQLVQRGIEAIEAHAAELARLNDTLEAIRDADDE